jgi:hypothetical protein
MMFCRRCKITVLLFSYLPLILLLLLPVFPDLIMFLLSSFTFAFLFFSSSYLFYFSLLSITLSHFPLLLSSLLVLFPFYFLFILLIFFLGSVLNRTILLSGSEKFLNTILKQVKVKKGKVVPVLLTKHQAMKAYWGSGCITPLIL